MNAALFLHRVLYHHITLMYIIMSYTYTYGTVPVYRNTVFAYLWLALFLQTSGGASA